MQVNKFSGRDFKSALAEVKRALGPDAVILSSRKVKSRDGMPLAAPIVEVTATLEPPDKALQQHGAAGPPADRNLQSLRTEVRELRGMLEEMRERIEFFAVNPAEADEGPLWEIYRGMLASGVEKCLAAELLQEARRTIGEEQLSERLVGLEVMASLVMDRLSLSHPLGLDPNKRIVSALIGPSGVGKTTTVAKLAAELVLDRHRPLSLITVDTYRIGAVEQLATYANILNVPFEVVQNASAFEEAVKRQEGRDILVDTTGHSPKDMQMVDELRRLFNNGVKAQAHLLIPAVSGPQEANEIMDCYDSFPLASLIVTKLDEVFRYGPLFSTMTDLGMPVSYFTTGQSVPDDIEQASKERVADLLLGITSN